VHLYDVPLIFVLAGLVLYTVLGGADFGAGFWQLFAGGGERGDRIREHAHHAMAPVWEANHVWVLFVITVSWTAYSVAFASIASTLCVPLFIAALGIILRGAAYALRMGASSTRTFDKLFAVSSILTPFALGTVVGGIASRRVPVGNAAGDLFSSWLNPTGIMVGVLAVASSAYLAAVYLAADSARLGSRDLEQWFRQRALVSGVAAGVVAVAGLFVLHSDALPLYRGLVEGDGLPALIVSGVAGVATLALVWQGRYEWARYSSGAAVAAIVAGWALAQAPVVLPGLTMQQAAAPDETLVAVIIAVLVGAVVLLPSLVLLFSLVLRGHFDVERPVEWSGPASERPSVLGASRQGLLMRATVASLLASIGFLNFADAQWAHMVGAVTVCAFLVLGFFALVPRELAAEEAGGPDGR
jgi:cytochrome d ubiquinol oxidase subunit II